MNIGALWDQFSLWVMQAGLPTVGAYHLLCSTAFLNVAAEDAKGLERIANLCLAPTQYLLAGKKAEPILSEEGAVVGYLLDQRFCYQDPALWVKTTAAYCALPSSLIIGSVLKGISYLSPDVRKRQDKISTSLAQGGSLFQEKNSYYQSIGMELVSWEEAQTLVPLNYERRPGDNEKLQAEKKALKEIVTLLREHSIVHWLDCGTCLGAYRYGGNIPWDWDLDLAILQPDFDNVKNVLSKLDPEKYVVQDWSSRDNPKTYLKVYVKETDALIDIYHFAIDEENQEVRSILSNGGSVFLPESWKIRERRYTMATPFSFVFPLRKANFDGVEVYVPNRTKDYLQQRYQNLEPSRIYSSITGQYEKDLDHPYWKYSTR